VNRVDSQDLIDERVFEHRFDFLEAIDVEALFYGPAGAGGGIHRGGCVATRGCRVLRGEREFRNPMDATSCPVPERGSQTEWGKHVAAGGTCTVVAQADRRASGFDLDEIVAAMHRHGIAGSRSAVWRLFDRHKISFKKKSVRAAEQERADVARARRRWMREQGLFDPARLVFVDETSTSTNMARQRGRCERGLRLIARVPQAHWQTVTFVAGLRHDGMVAPFVINGPMTGASFLAYLEQCLVPTLKRDDIVFVDHLKAHQVAGVREAIETAGATLRYLPRYSPDLDPIEPALSSKPFCAKPPSGQFAASGAELDP